MNEIDNKKSSGKHGGTREGAGRKTGIGTCGRTTSV